MPRYRVTRARPAWERETVIVEAADHNHAAVLAELAARRGHTEYKDGDAPDDAPEYVPTWEAEYLDSPAPAPDHAWSIAAIPCRYCARTAGGVPCVMWELSGNDVHDGRMARDLAFLAAAGPQLADALEALMQSSASNVFAADYRFRNAYDMAARVLDAARTGVGLNIDRHA